MLETTVEEYLRSKGHDVWRAGSGQLTLQCLWHDDASHRKGKLYVSAETGAFDCKVCGTQGGLRMLMEHFGDEPDENQKSFRASRKLAINSEYAGVAHGFLTDVKGNAEVLEYLRERGLSDDVIAAAKIGFHGKGVSVVASMPNAGVKGGYTREEIRETGLVSESGREFLTGRITIPYLSYGQVLQVRGKDPKGKYVTPPGEPVRLYNEDALRGAESVILVEGEFDCYLEGTEVFTPQGWVALEDWSGHQVLQYHEDGALSFVTPSAYGRRHADELVRIYGERTGSLDLVVTPGHRMVSTARDGSVRIHRADERQPSSFSIPKVGTLDGPGIPLSDDEIALILAMSADATLDTRKYDGRQYARMGFVKERKIQRIIKLLERVGVEFSRSVEASGNTSVCFKVPVYLEAKKILPVEWIALATARQREFILSELVEWDGSHVTSRTQDEYSSRELANAEWVQALAHTAGRVSTLMSRSNAYGSWWKVSILHEKRQVSWQSLKTEPAGPGTVYCVEVPTGMLLVRRNGVVAVSGNCLILQEVLRLSPDAKARNLAVVAVPGTQALPGGKEDFAKHFESARRVYVAFDADDAGRRGAMTVRELIGKAARIVELPDEGCDWTDWLAPKTSQRPHGGHTWHDVMRLITEADMREKRVFTVQDAAAQLYELEHSAPGIELGFPTLDAYIKPGLRPGQLIIPLARTGVGKSIFLANVVYNTRHLPSLFLTLELTNMETWTRLRRIARFHHPAMEEHELQDLFPNLRLVDENVVASGDIDRIIEDFIEDHGQSPQVIYVDYLGYFARGQRGNSQYEKMSNAVMTLKAKAKEHRAIIISPGQVNRGAAPGAPISETDARDAGAIEETADFLFGIWRPWESATVDGAIPAMQSELKLNILKSRHGNKGRVVPLAMSHHSLVVVDTVRTKLANKVDMENGAYNRGESYDDVYQRSREAALAKLQSTLNLESKETPPWEQ